MRFKTKDVIAVDSEIAGLQTEMQNQLPITELPVTEPDKFGELTEAQYMKFKRLAAMVKGNEHFAAILQTAGFEERESLYHQIAPHLTFRALPFDEMRFF